MGRRYLHIRKYGGTGYKMLPISKYFDDGKKKFVSDNDIHVGLKEAATVLGYPERGIPIDRIDTHSLRIGGANALSLVAGLTGISKSWDNGVARLSRSTFGNNCQIFGTHVEKHEEVLWFCEFGGRRLLGCD